MVILWELLSLYWNVDSALLYVNALYLKRSTKYIITVVRESCFIGCQERGRLEFLSCALGKGANIFRTGVAIG